MKHGCFSQFSSWSLTKRDISFKFRKVTYNQSSVDTHYIYWFPLQANPDRRRLWRGETVEVCSPLAGLDNVPRLRERPLGRCHTLDLGDEAASSENTPHGDKHIPGTVAQLLPDGGETYRPDCSSAPETPPTLPYNTPSDSPHTSADQPHEPSSHSLRPLNRDSSEGCNKNDVAHLEGDRDSESHHPVYLCPQGGGDWETSGFKTKPPTGKTADFCLLLF